MEVRTAPPGAQDRWVLVTETTADPNGLSAPGQAPTPPWRCTVARGVRLADGEQVTVGRGADLTAGIEVADTSVSRQALTVRATPAGWQLEVGNRNGAVLYPWGQAPLPLTGSTAVEWPLAAVRLLGDPALEHWVLLEAPQSVPTREGATRSAPSGYPTTDAQPPPRGLTEAQTQALHALFGDLLRWPPPATAAPRQLQQAARALGISTEAVQARLRPVITRAEQLGMGRALARPGEPDYLYVLVRAGYLPPPQARTARREVRR